MPPITKNQLEAKLIDRFFMISLVIVGALFFYGCLHLVVGAYVKLKDDPPWVKVVTHPIDVVVYLIGPGLMFWRTSSWQKRFIANFSARLGDLEARIDPNRATSGLQRDGTDPPSGFPP